MTDRQTRILARAERTADPRFADILRALAQEEHTIRVR